MYAEADCTRPSAWYSALWCEGISVYFQTCTENSHRLHFSSKSLLISFSFALDVGGYFESGTLVRYDFMSGSITSPVAKGALGAMSVEGNLTQEELSFSFSTTQAPSVLAYISSRTQDYLAVVLRHNGETVEVDLLLTGSYVTIKMWTFFLFCPFFLSSFSIAFFSSISGVCFYSFLLFSSQPFVLKCLRKSSSL